MKQKTPNLFAFFQYSNVFATGTFHVCFTQSQRDSSHCDSLFHWDRNFSIFSSVFFCSIVDSLLFFSHFSHHWMVDFEMFWWYDSIIFRLDISILCIVSNFFFNYISVNCYLSFVTLKFPLSFQVFEVRFINFSFRTIFKLKIIIATCCSFFVLIILSLSVCLCELNATFYSSWLKLFVRNFEQLFRCTCPSRRGQHRLIKIAANDRCGVQINAKPRKP